VTKEKYTILDIHGRPLGAENPEMSQDDQNGVEARANEAMKALVEMFSGPPQPRGKCRWQHCQYELIRLDDGTIGFVRNAFDAEMERIFGEIMEELFGPEPAEDEHILMPPFAEH
jgi:hypothetical protein